MEEVILVCGFWSREKSRWNFEVDKDKSCRILEAGIETTYSDFIIMVYEDFQLDKVRCEVELSYMFSRKKLQRLPQDTPPVFVTNSRQLHGFLSQSKLDPLRLCVVVKERNENDQSCENEKDQNWCREGKVGIDVVRSVDREIDSKFASNNPEENVDVEFDSRFDYCDDPDGASSDDEDFSIYGMFDDYEVNDSPMKKQREKKGDDDFLKLEIESLKVRVGQQYESKEALETRLKLLSILNRFDFDVDKSDPSLLVVKCWIEGCTWRLRASPIECAGGFYVRKYVDVHTCSVTERSSRSRQATPDILGILYKDYLGGIGPNVIPIHVAEAINKRFAIKIDYWKAHRTLKCARQLVTGTSEKGYEEIPTYLHMISRENPGTITRLVVDDASRFKYLFLAFGASMRGFLFMRKAVVVDGTFLKGKYKGTLLIASAQDGNFQIFPIAFAVVDTENDASWEWFFTQLINVIPDDKELAIISDRHGSIGKAIAKIYPLSSRGICTYHLYNNILVRFKGKATFKLVKKAANCYKLSEFEDVFAEIRSINPGLYSYLERADVSMWARVHFPGDRYNLTTTNIAESFNKVLSSSRSLPIVCLLEEIRSMMTRWFSTRRNDAAKMNTMLTRGVEKMLEARVNHARMLTVQEIDPHLMQVANANSLDVVNLYEKKCSCRRFDLEKLPCVHALAAAEVKRLSATTLCHSYYHKKYLVLAYSGTIMPRDVAMHAPEEVMREVCLPPLVRQPPGRPKKARNKSALEIAMKNKRPRKEYTCSRCNQVGHNCKTCNVVM